MNWNVIWETAKFPLRLIVLAIIPVILNYLGVLPPFWRDLSIAVLVVVDKYLHELWKEDDERITGLVPF